MLYGVYLILVNQLVNKCIKCITQSSKVSKVKFTLLKGKGILFSEGDT